MIEEDNKNLDEAVKAFNEAPSVTEGLNDAFKIIILEKNEE